MNINNKIAIAILLVISFCFTNCNKEEIITEEEKTSEFTDNARAFFEENAWICNYLAWEKPLMNKAEVWIYLPKLSLRIGITPRSTTMDWFQLWKFHLWEMCIKVDYIKEK